ncbi:MAG: hypothetical protein ACJ764_13050 [Solirubrobacteraceae bacterium]
MLGVALLGGGVVLGPGSTVASASSARTCDWGGTLAKPTGSVKLSPGITNSPATGPLSFYGTGGLSGGSRCHGRVTFVGEVAAGSTCAFATYHGRVYGLPGVYSYAGAGSAVVQDFLYDRQGRVVGADQPVAHSSSDPTFMACGTSQGLTSAQFSAKLEVWGAGSGFVTLASAHTRAAASQAPRTCTWGGTPLAPTGQNHNAEGISNTASTHPIDFYATGPLAGQCSGTLTFEGTMDTGATCSKITFHGRAFGIPGVARFAGVAAGGVGPARLYDGHGNLVGSENANFLVDPTVISKCNTPQGVVDNTFQSLIELLGK